MKHHHSEAGRHAVVRFLEGAKRRQAAGDYLATMPADAMTVGANLAAIEQMVLGV